MVTNQNSNFNSFLLNLIAAQTLQFRFTSLNLRNLNFKLYNFNKYGCYTQFTISQHFVELVCKHISYIQLNRFKKLVQFTFKLILEWQKKYNSAHSFVDHILQLLSMQLNWSKVFSLDAHWCASSRLIFSLLSFLCNTSPAFVDFSKITFFISVCL